MTQSRNGKEKIISEKTPCQQLNDFAKEEGARKPVYRVIENKWGDVKKEFMGRFRVSKVQIFILIECDFMHKTFRGEAGNKNGNTETKTSKEKMAKNQAAEKALVYFWDQEQVDTTHNNQKTAKKPQTPLGIAIQFNNIRFISKFIIFINLLLFLIPTVRVPL